MITNFKELNKTLTLDKANLIILGGRTESGKSTLVLDIVNNIGIKENIPILYFNLETTKDILVSQLVCINSNIDYSNFRNGNLDDNEWENLSRITKQLEESKIYIDDTSNISIQEICKKARKCKIENDVKIIVIDSLQFISYDKGQLLSRDKEIEEILCQLKKLSKELKIPVLVTSQLTRTESIKPTINDFHESNAVMENANVVMLLYRDEKENFKMSISKNDYGECKDISL